MKNKIFLQILVLFFNSSYANSDELRTEKSQSPIQKGNNNVINYILKEKLEESAKKGRTLLYSGKLNDAKIEFESAIEDDIKNVSSTMDSLSRIKEYQSKIKTDEGFDVIYFFFEKAINRNNKKTSENVFFLAKIAEDEKKVIEAESYYKKSISLNRENTASWNSLGNLLLTDDRLDEAMNAYQTVERLGIERNNKKEIAVAYGNIGNVYKKKGQLDKALDYYGKSFEINQSIGNKDGMKIDYTNIRRSHSSISQPRVYKTLMEMDIQDTKKLECEPDRDGHLDTQLALYRSGIIINKKASDKEALENDNLNIADILYKKCKLKEAIDYYRTSLLLSKEIKSKDKNRTIYTLRRMGDINLMLAYSTKKSYFIDEAVYFFNESLSINEKLLNSDERVRDYSNIGYAHNMYGTLRSQKR